MKYKVGGIYKIEDGRTFKIDDVRIYTGEDTISRTGYTVQVVVTWEATGETETVPPESMLEGVDYA